MRAISSIVVLSSLLNAAIVLAAPDDKKGTSPGSTAQPAKTPAPSGAPAPAPKPAAPTATPTGTPVKPTATPTAAPAGAPAKPAKAAPTGAPTGAPAKQPAPTATPAPAPAPATPAPAAQDPAPAPGPTAAIDPATVKPEDMPTAVRMRRLEQRTQLLKERAWQLKARVQLLKEQMLGPGAGAQALITHANEMGSSFRLIKIIYTLNGTQVFVRSDETAESLYKTRSFDIFAGPISPGNHNLAAVATYRGHGYGVFEYLKKYTFVANGKQSFTTGEGKVSKVECKGFEKGGPTTPMEKRAAIECKVTQLAPEKPTALPTPAAPTPGMPSAPATPAATPPAPATPAPAPATPAPAPATPAPAPATPAPAAKPGK